MKHDLYKLADQHHLNANEQQLLQSVLETAKNGGERMPFRTRPASTAHPAVLG